MLSEYLNFPEMTPPSPRWMMAIILAAVTLLTATLLLPASRDGRASGVSTAASIAR